MLFSATLPAGFHLVGNWAPADESHSSKNLLWLKIISSTSPMGFALTPTWNWIYPITNANAPYFLVTFPRDFMYILKKGKDTAGPSSTRSLSSLGAALPALPAGGENSGRLWNIRMSLLQCLRRCFSGQALWHSAVSCPAAGSPVKHGEPCMGSGCFRAVVYSCGLLPSHHLVSEQAQPEPSASSGLTRQFIGRSVSFWEVRMPLQYRRLW